MAIPTTHPLLQADLSPTSTKSSIQSNGSVPTLKQSIQHLPYATRPSRRSSETRRRYSLVPSSWKSTTLGYVERALPPTRQTVVSLLPSRSCEISRETTHCRLEPLGRRNVEVSRITSPDRLWRTTNQLFLPRFPSLRHPPRIKDSSTSDRTHRRMNLSRRVRKVD